MSKKINIKTLKFVIDNNVYPFEAVCAACYMFIDRAYIFLDSQGANKVKVSLRSKTKITSKQLQRMKNEFLNELLHNVLRITVSKKNKKIREFIVGRALFSAVENPEVGDEDFMDDPLGIAVPWEEKYGSKK